MEVRRGGGGEMEVRRGGGGEMEGQLGRCSAHLLADGEGIREQPIAHLYEKVQGRFREGSGKGYESSPSRTRPRSSSNAATSRRMIWCGTEGACDRMISS